MFEKKNLVINCDVCDTRKVKEEALSSYEKILINGDILLVSEHSKEVLNRLPIVCNVDSIVELGTDEEVSVVSYNGSYEINEGNAPKGKAILSVNGSLNIKPGTQEVLQHYLKICVNGYVSCPESLSGYLGNIAVNGMADTYPDSCTILKSPFVLDRYFPLRAKENETYYTRGKVVLLDSEADLSMLLAKNVRFCAKKLIVTEDKVADAIRLVDETAKLVVVPKGCRFVPDDAVLNEALLARYGTTLYVDGDLTLEKESTALLSELSKLYVNGNVKLFKEQLEEFQKLEAEYEELVIIKGRTICNKITVKVDSAMLEASLDGISIVNFTKVILDEDIEPEKILELLQLTNGVSVVCTPRQRSAVEMISKNIVSIKDGTEDPEEDTDTDEEKQMKDSRIINADQYTL